MLLAPREYGCAHTMPGAGGMGLDFAPNRRKGFRVWVSRQTGAAHLGFGFRAKPAQEL